MNKDIVFTALSNRTTACEDRIFSDRFRYCGISGIIQTTAQHSAADCTLGLKQVPQFASRIAIGQKARRAKIEAKKAE